VRLDRWVPGTSARRADPRPGTERRAVLCGYLTLPTGDEGELP
jgi:hypothetical protein